MAWNGDEEVGSAGDDESPETKDESAAYLEFLNEEVSLFPTHLSRTPPRVLHQLTLSFHPGTKVQSRD